MINKCLWSNTSVDQHVARRFPSEPDTLKLPPRGVEELDPRSAARHPHRGGRNMSSDTPEKESNLQNYPKTTRMVKEIARCRYRSL